MREEKTFDRLAHKGYVRIHLKGLSLKIEYEEATQLY